ncbi:MAG: hypothetical protein ACRD0A_10920 [Acidimicrobiales bacterium]
MTRYPTVGGPGRALALALALGGSAVVASAGPAAAEVDGPCAGAASFRTGTEAAGSFTVDPAAVAPGDVIEVPIADSVAWEGSLPDLAPQGAPADAASLAALMVDPRPVSGAIAVDLPWPLGGALLGEWDGESDALAGLGEDRYELPAVVPRGVDFLVSGEHVEGGRVYCSGSVLVRVEGGVFDTPVPYASAALTLVTGGALVWAGRPALHRATTRTGVRP